MSSAVLDPFGRAINAQWGFNLIIHASIIELAEASGIILLGLNEYSPFKAHTFGTGELIIEATATVPKPILWRKIKYGLSAGRVQSVSVRLVVEREREIDTFRSTSTFKTTAFFDLNEGKVLKAELPRKFKSEEEGMNY